jgi:hypothetical protein
VERLEKVYDLEGGEAAALSNVVDVASQWIKAEVDETFFADFKRAAGTDVAECVSKSRFLVLAKAQAIGKKIGFEIEEVLSAAGKKRGAEGQLEVLLAVLRFLGLLDEVAERDQKRAFLSRMAELGADKLRILKTLAHVADQRLTGGNWSALSKHVDNVYPSEYHKIAASAIPIPTVVEKRTREWENDGNNGGWNNGGGGNNGGGKNAKKGKGKKGSNSYTIITADGKEIPKFVPRGLCNDFAKTGACSRGTGCRFEHDRKALCRNPSDRLSWETTGKAAPPQATAKEGAEAGKKEENI